MTLSLPLSSTISLRTSSNSVYDMNQFEFSCLPAATAGPACRMIVTKDCCYTQYTSKSPLPELYSDVNSGMIRIISPSQYKARLLSNMKPDERNDLLAVLLHSGCTPQCPKIACPQYVFTYLLTSRATLVLRVPQTVLYHQNSYRLFLESLVHSHKLSFTSTKHLDGKAKFNTRELQSSNTR